MKQSKGDIAFDVVVIVLLTLILLIMIYPMYFILIASISDPGLVVSGKVFLYPRKVTMESYQMVFETKSIWTGYLNTVIYTVLGTMYNLCTLIPAAYVMSKKNLPGRGFFSMFFFITMYFGGGMIPTYLLMKNLGLLDTRWVLILGSVSCYNLIVARQYYQNSIPESLYEAARIDGASEFKCFFRIALPLSSSIIAVMTLFHAVGHWNSYYNALLYVHKADYYPLQLILRELLLLNQNVLEGAILDDPDAATWAIRRMWIAESMKYSIIFISCAPLLVAYPFVQKYFVKGVMIGSVKG